MVRETVGETLPLLPSRTSKEKVSTLVFFFNDTATTEIYTLSLHDALPILPLPVVSVVTDAVSEPKAPADGVTALMLCVSERSTSVKLRETAPVKFPNWGPA